MKYFAIACFVFAILTGLVGLNIVAYDKGVTDGGTPFLIGVFLPTVVFLFGGIYFWLKHKR